MYITGDVQSRQNWAMHLDCRITHRALENFIDEVENFKTATLQISRITQQTAQIAKPALERSRPNWEINWNCGITRRALTAAVKFKLTQPFPSAAGPETGSGGLDNEKERRRGAWCEDNSCRILGEWIRKTVGYRHSEKEMERKERKTNVTC